MREQSLWPSRQPSIGAASFLIFRSMRWRAFVQTARGPGAACGRVTAGGVGEGEASVQP